MWIVAHAHDGRERDGAINDEGERPAQAVTGEPAPDPDRDPVREQPWRGCGAHGSRAPLSRAPQWWPMSVAAGVDDGLAHRMDRVRATGNGQVPAVAAMAWRLLTGLGG
jgi:DNA (cytosine-5)-methyltransferase 1